MNERFQQPMSKSLAAGTSGYATATVPILDTTANKYLPRRRNEGHERPRRIVIASPGSSLLVSWPAIYQLVYSLPCARLYRGRRTSATFAQARRIMDGRGKHDLDPISGTAMTRSQVSSRHHLRPGHDTNYRQSSPRNGALLEPASRALGTSHDPDRARSGNVEARSNIKRHDDCVFQGIILDRNFCAKPNICFSVALRGPRSFSVLKITCLPAAATGSQYQTNAHKGETNENRLHRTRHDGLRNGVQPAASRP
jgi:hypothetical protein